MMSEFFLGLLKAHGLKRKQKFSSSSFERRKRTHLKEIHEAQLQTKAIGSLTEKFILVTPFFSLLSTLL